MAEDHRAVAFEMLVVDGGWRLPLLFADHCDLLARFISGLECDWTDLNPGCFGRACFYHFAFLRRLLLHNIIFGHGG
jgi:hypothetical protein